jgi:hypothetical protein
LNLPDDPAKKSASSFANKVCVRPWSLTSWLSLGLLLWAGVETLAPSLFLPVKVVSDGPIYHLYFAARWWKAGAVFPIAAPFGESAAPYFPANGDLWFTWLMFSAGGDALARIGQAPFWVMAGIASYGLARRLGASEGSSLIAVTWFLSSTPLLLFSFEPNVDTIFIAGYLTACFFFLRFAMGDDGWPSLLLGGLAAGLALGTKAVGVVFVPPLLLWPLASILGLGRRSGDDSPERSLRFRLGLVVVLVLATLATSAAWFLRNLFLTGNPLYPLEIRLLGQTIAPGWYDAEAMRTSKYYLPVGDWRSLVDILLAILDPRLAPFWLIAVLIVLIVPGRLLRKRSDEDASRKNNLTPLRILVLLAVANVALYWLLIPYRTQQRFMLQAIGLAVPALALGFDAGRLARCLGAALVAIHLLTPASWPFVGPRDLIPWDLSPLIPNAIDPPVRIFGQVARLRSATAGATSEPIRSLIASSVMGLTAIGIAWLWRRPASSQRKIGRRIAATVATSILLLGSGALLWLPWSLTERQRFYALFPDYYLGWMNFDVAAGPSGARVAYAGTNLPYYLLGVGLRNEVQYVNIDEHRDWLLHDYHRLAALEGQGTWPDTRPGWDRLHPDYKAWLANLDAERIQLLVVARANPDEGRINPADPEGFPIERQWAESHPERFRPVYGTAERDPEFRVYRVLPPPRSGSAPD